MNDERQIRYFEMQKERAPERRFWLPLADLYRRSSRLDEARRLLEDGLTRHPDSIAARWVLAQVLADQGEIARSGRLLDEVTAADPDHGLAADVRQRLQTATPTAPPEVETSPAADEERDAEPSITDTTVEEDAAETITSPVPQQKIPADEPQRVQSVEPPAREPDPDAANQDVRGEASTPEESPADSPETPPAQEIFVTRTLADIYLAQGHQEKALQILRQIHRVHPEREDVLAQIKALKAGVAAVQEPVKRELPEVTPERELENRRRFENWLERERGKSEGS